MLFKSASNLVTTLSRYWFKVVSWIRPSINFTEDLFEQPKARWNAGFLVKTTRVCIYLWISWIEINHAGCLASTISWQGIVKRFIKTKNYNSGKIKYLKKFPSDFTLQQIFLSQLLAHWNGWVHLDLTSCSSDVDFLACACGYSVALS